MGAALICGVVCWVRAGVSTMVVRTLYYDGVCGGEGGLLLACRPYTKRVTICTCQKQCDCQLLFLALWLPTFIFDRILPKTLFTAKIIEHSMNATSSRVSTVKSGFGCQE